jgi:hypothetical protein
MLMAGSMIAVMVPGVIRMPMVVMHWMAPRDDDGYDVEPEGIIERECGISAWMSFSAAKVAPVQGLE